MWPLRLSLIALLAFSSCSRDTPQPEVLSVDPSEFRIVAYSGNALPPDAGGFDYNYWILGEIESDGIDLFFGESGTRPGNQRVDINWMGELRGQELERAMALVRQTRWIEREKPKETVGGSTGGSYAGFSVTVNNGRFMAAPAPDGWRALAEMIERRALQNVSTSASTDR